MAVLTGILLPTLSPKREGERSAALRETGSSSSNFMMPLSNASKVMYKVINLVNEAGYLNVSADWADKTSPVLASMIMDEVDA